VVDNQATKNPAISDEKGGKSDWNNDYLISDEEAFLKKDI